MENVEEFVAQEVIATENDWLDVTYTAKKYLEEKESDVKARKPKKSRGLWKNIAIYGVSAAACAALVVGLTFGKGTTFDTARTTATAALFGQNKTVSKHTVTLPVNVNVESVQGGTMTFSGGRAVLSFTQGTVKAVAKDTVTVDVDADTQIVYGGLTAVYVAVGDKLETNQLIGKYDGTATASIYDGGEAVMVVGGEDYLYWNV